MGPGLLLLVLGALLAFAVKDDMPGVDLGVAGLILMVSGAAVIAHARGTARKERRVERPQHAEPRGAGDREGGPHRLRSLHPSGRSNAVAIDGAVAALRR